MMRSVFGSVIVMGFAIVLALVGFLQTYIPLSDWGSALQDTLSLSVSLPWWDDALTWWMKFLILAAVNIPVALVIWAVFTFVVPKSIQGLVATKSMISIPYLWLLVLFFVPFGIVLKISLSDLALAIPPYTPTIKDGLWALVAGLDLENYAFIGAGAVFASFLFILLATVLFRVIYPRVKSGFFANSPTTTFTAAAMALTALAVSIATAALLFGALSLLVPAFSRFVDIPDFLYFAAYLSSLKIAVISTFLTLL